MKKFIGLAFTCLSFFITSVSMAETPYKVVVHYFADCPSKDYAKCAKENKEFILKNVDEDSFISDLKNLIFKMSKDKKFLPCNQVITCGKRWPNDSDYADICWDKKSNGVLVDLHLRN